MTDVGHSPKAKRGSQRFVGNEEICALVAERVRTVGPKRAALEFGVGRDTVLSIALGGERVRAATFSFLRERLSNPLALSLQTEGLGARRP